MNYSEDVLLKQYASLHNHTDFSNTRMLDSTNKVHALIEKSIELGMKGLAITDHESLSSHVRAIQYVKSLKKDNPDNKVIQDFKLMLGNEVYLHPNGTSKEDYAQKKEGFYHFILIAKDKIGHKQLRELSTRAWQNSYREFIERVPIFFSDLEAIIGEDKGHLVASTACLGGYIPQQILKAGGNSTNLDLYRAKIDEFIDWAQSIFGEDFYLELQPSMTKEQVYVNKQLIELAKKKNLKSIITTDSHYLTRADREVHKAYLNAGEGEREVDAFYSSTYLMEVEELADYLSEYVEEDFFASMLDNTLEIADKCDSYDLYHVPIVPKIEIELDKINCTPEQAKEFFASMEKEGYRYITKFANSEHEQDRNLMLRVFSGLVEKFKPDEIKKYHIERIEKELKELWEISEKMGERLSAYLITVSKIIEIIWNEGDSLVGPSRGSALGFFINYLLDITQISPLDKEIPLEHWRFINASRVSLPDVDIDTQSNRRAKILLGLKEYFGNLNVVNVCTFGTEKPKSAIQTAARGLGLSSDEGLYLSSMVPSERGLLWSLHDCFYGNEEEGRKPVKAFVDAMTGEYSEVWEVARNIEGLISRRGIHAGGVVIANDNMVDTNALMKSPTGKLTTQYDLDDTEYMGGLKFDLLSVEALDKIRAEIELLSEYGYIERKDTLKETYMSILNPEDRSILEYENPEIWSLAHDDRVLSLFQMETPVGGAAIKRIKPENIAQLSSINSLMRLMAAGATEMPMDRYLRYKRDMQEWVRDMESYGLNGEEIKLMEKHLKPNYGVAESQEAMMMMVMDPEISNFSVAESDKLRKAVAKKSMRDFEQAQALFYKRGKELGTSENLLRYVWEVQIKTQKGYSLI